jgi:predicted nucleic acid-binding protein
LILTIDTFAWVEIFRGSSLGFRATEALKAAEACLTPSVVLAEVAAVGLRSGLPDEVVERRLRAIREASEIVPIDDQIAVASARCTQELRQAARTHRLSTPGLADGLVLATSRRSHSRLLTGDLHFRALHDTLWLS